MTPSLIKHSGDLLPRAKFKEVRSAIVWDRDGHFRFIPQGRVRDFRRLVEYGGGRDRKAPTGIRWEDTEEMA